MENLIEIFEETINDELYQIILSNPRKKDGVTKVKVRPLLQKERLFFQVSSFTGTKVLHSNYEKKELAAYLTILMNEQFKQMEIESVSQRITVLSSKKGKLSIQKKQTELTERNIDFSHNRVKKYILEEGKPVDFLIELGVQNSEGKIIAKRYDKFKQINRFLEFIEDILPTLPKERPITVLDFGCGKSYLTFAMYHYLKILQQREANIIGLDLKEDVISSCNRLSQRFGYEGLTFLQGDIGTYKGMDRVDMVVTLHACDTATDYALQKAVEWGAKVILSVPCCQHEANQQIECGELHAVLKYGLIKERMAALITDAVRANLLEAYGYETQILEFIDMEHTPKNILIRAVKREGKQKTGKPEEIDALLAFLHLNPTLKRICEESENCR